MERLQKEDALIIFTYAPAGLGHLRVTDALYEGLPKEVDCVVLGADDTRITYWHRIMSNWVALREAIEKAQLSGWGRWFYDFYVWLLRVNTDKLYFQMKNVITTQWKEKKKVVVVSTHFGLAHQIAKIKDKLEKDLSIKIKLVVQVTDATSIEIWYVPGADLICVPSKKVKKELLANAEKRGWKKTEIVVSPYPLSPELSIKLGKQEFDLRLREYSKESKVNIRIVMPISGAAVGLEYYEKLISKLGLISERFEIFLVTKKNIHTTDFIRKMKLKKNVKVIEDKNDKKVVDNYEKIYDEEVVGLEVVKPSEQAFKALFAPNQRGGAIMLLTEPIGKQEHDNVEFLLDHKLIPCQEDQDKIERYAREDKIPEDGDCSECIKRARLWKAIQLTNDVERDVELINWGIKTGIFREMAGTIEKVKEKDPELAANGVKQFWERVDKLI